MRVPLGKTTYPIPVRCPIRLIVMSSPFRLRQQYTPTQQLPVHISPKLVPFCYLVREKF